MPELLRYRISNIQDLPQCLSNNSKDFRIAVSDVDNGHLLGGTRIEVVHRLYGTLFATTLNARGELTTPVSDMTQEQIFQQLKRFGFIVEFADTLKLSKAQFDALKALLLLRYDKIRFISILKKYSGGEGLTRLIAFKSGESPELLDTTYTLYEDRFNEYKQDGIIYEITLNFSGADWTWLTYAASIQHLIDTSEVGD